MSPFHSCLDSNFSEYHFTLLWVVHSNSSFLFCSKITFSMEPPWIPWTTFSTFILLLYWYGPACYYILLWAAYVRIFCCLRRYVLTSSNEIFLPRSKTSVYVCGIKMDLQEDPFQEDVYGQSQKYWLTSRSIQAIVHPVAEGKALNVDWIDTGWFWHVLLAVGRSVYLMW